MKIYQAETGATIDIYLPENATLVSLKESLAQATDIPPENQILLEREGSIVEIISDDIFLFDRASFSKQSFEPEKCVDFETDGIPYFDAKNYINKTNRNA